MASKKRFSHGFCALCGATGIAKRAMEKHLNDCPKRATPRGDRQVSHLVVSFPYDPRYWLYIEVNESAQLCDLDAFLRDIWLECCEHMSSFTIAQERYVSPDAGVTREYGDRSMRAPLQDLLLPGMQFFYEYDFGSTTELTLLALEHGVAKTRGAPVRLLARNEPLAFSCRSCGKSGTILCMECQEDAEDTDDVVYCDRCIHDQTKHRHDEDMRLPVVNSPRMGVCGYTGE